MESVPRLIESLAKKGEKIAHVAAGVNHSACVTENGEVRLFFHESIVVVVIVGSSRALTTNAAHAQVYMWGHGTWVEPHKITAIKERKIVRVSCGNNFTAALSDAGDLFTWGKSWFVARHGGARSQTGGRVD